MLDKLNLVLCDGCEGAAKEETLDDNGLCFDCQSSQEEPSFYDEYEEHRTHPR